MSKHAASATDRIRRLFAARPTGLASARADAIAPAGDPDLLSPWDAATMTAATPTAAASANADGDPFSSARPPRRRWTPRSMRAIVIGFAAVVAIIGWWWWQGQPKQVSAAPVSAPMIVASSAPASAEVVVHVVGDVTSPGLVRLAKGARVADAIDAAGGVRKGGRLGAVNLARAVVDGEQIVVGRNATAAAEGGANADGTVNLNAATAGDLEALPGIGPVLAQRIVTWRDANGPFTAVEQLREVSGIGDSTFSDISALVRV